MKETIEHYQRWKEENPDEDYQYDMIHEFLNMLSRSQQYSIMEFAEEQYKLNQQ